jgi:hypothetical protein
MRSRSLAAERLYGTRAWYVESVLLCERRSPQVRNVHPQAEDLRRPVESDFPRRGVLRQRRERFHSWQA